MLSDTSTALQPCSAYPTSGSVTAAPAPGPLATPLLLLSALGLNVYEVLSTHLALREYSGSVFCILIAVLSLCVCVVLCVSLCRWSP